MSPTGRRIGSKIRRAREQRHLTQNSLASLLGVSRSAVVDWENDRALPRHIYRVEDALGVKLTENGDEPRPEYEDPALQYIWETPGLTEEVRRALVALAVAMREQAARRA